MTTETGRIHKKVIFIDFYSAKGAGIMSGLSSHKIACEIFAELLPYRRRFPDPIMDQRSEEQEVAAIQIPRLQAFIDRGETITCVLPAFPTKSPNPNKVLNSCSE